MTNQLLTAKQMADHLQLKAETIRVWARQGLIPVLHPTAKTMRFDLPEVLAAIRRMSHETTGPEGGQKPPGGTE